MTIEAPLEAPAGAGRAERVMQILCRQAELMHAYFLRVPSQYHYAQLLGVSEWLRKRLASESD